MIEQPSVMKAASRCFSRPSAVLIWGALVSFAGVGSAHAEEELRLSTWVSAGVDDNVFRNDAVTEPDPSDWFRVIGVALEGARLNSANSSLQLDGEVHWTDYDEFGELDHLGGKARLGWEWRANPTLDGSLGYTFERKLQAFDNQNSNRANIVEKQGISAAVTKVLGARWRVGFEGEANRFNLDTTQQLDKDQIDLRLQADYAQSNVLQWGVYGTHRDAQFDSDDSRNFDSRSIGVALKWEPTSTLRLVSELAHMRQELKDPVDSSDRFSGIVGKARLNWQQSERLLLRLTAYRDISNLGGEVADYTERKGISLEPEWKMSDRLLIRGALEFEARDFVTTSVTLTPRDEDVFTLRCAAEWQVRERLAVTGEYSYRTKESTIDSFDFDDNLFVATLRFDI